MNKTIIATQSKTYKETLTLKALMDILEVGYIPSAGDKSFSDEPALVSIAHDHEAEEIARLLKTQFPTTQIKLYSLHELS